MVMTILFFGYAISIIIVMMMVIVVTRILDTVSKIRRYFHCCNLWTMVGGFDVHFWCTEKQHQKAEEILKSMPSEISLLADKKGLTVKILSQDLFANMARQRGQSWIMAYLAAGFYCADINTVAINASFPGMKDTIAHELAHFCDYSIGKQNFFSDDDDNLGKELKKHQGISKVPMYNKINHREFLAYCMSNYICDKPNRLTAEMIAISESYLAAVKGELN